MFIGISNKEFDKISKINWSEYIKVHNIGSNHTKIKKKYWTEAKKQSVVIKFKKEARNSVEEEVSKHRNIDCMDLNGKLAESNNELKFAIDEKQSKIVEVSKCVANKRQKIDLMDINLIDSLSYNKMKSIHKTLAESIQKIKSWKDLGNLIKEVIHDWIQR